MPYVLPLYHIDGLVQDCSISIANALEILQSCTEPSIFKRVGIICVYKKIRIFHYCLQSKQMFNEVKSINTCGCCGVCDNTFEITWHFEWEIQPTQNADWALCRFLCFEF